MLIWVFTVATMILIIVYVVVSFIAQIVAAPVNSQGYLDVKFKLGCFGTLLFLFGLIAVPFAIAFSTDIRRFDDRNIFERATLLLLFYCGSAWLIILVRTSQGNLLRAAGNMKFSIRTLSVWIVFAALCAAMMAHWYQSRSLSLKLDRLREASGLIASEGTGDKYVLLPIGEWSGMTSTTPAEYLEHDYCYLLQVQNHETYRLELTFYDGITKESVTTNYELSASQTAITYLPEFQLIRVHDAKQPVQNSTTLNVTGTERYFATIRPHSSGNVIRIDRPILAFCFLGSAENRALRGAGNEDNYKTVSRINEACKKYQMNCAYFILKEHEIQE